MYPPIHACLTLQPPVPAFVGVLHPQAWQCIEQTVIVRVEAAALRLCQHRLRWRQR